MKELVKIALESAEQAELYYKEESSDSISFVDAKLDKADSSMSSGLALRIIKDGKIGLAHTRNLLDKSALVSQALQSAKFGMEAGFSFPNTPQTPMPDKYDTALEAPDKQSLIAEGMETLAYIKSKTSAQVNLDYSSGCGSFGIINSAGTELEHRDSAFSIFAQLIFPGTGSGVFDYITSNSRSSIPKEAIDRLIELFEISKEEIVPNTGAMPIIFTPMSSYALFSRLETAMHAANIHNRISPLCDRFGEKIISEKLSFWQDPMDPELLHNRSFDDEGSPTKYMQFFDKGVLTAIPVDLHYANKLQMQPTGNGFRGSVGALPAPGFAFVNMQTGNSSLEAMISSISEGILVQSVMGAHSGNILNGDFSVGVSTGFMIKDGKLVGRVKDCMLSGNVYDVLQRVIEVENTCKLMGNRKIASIMLDAVSVAGK